MRLAEAILEANGQLSAANPNPVIDEVSLAGSLPLVALTCIDPRLNRLIPKRLGVSEDRFIWLRNAGNIISGPLSSTMRSLALACAIKGGREIAVIGHTDCLVGKTTVLSLTEGFRALGVERSKLPDNLNEYFGLFASERQNVMHSVAIVRQSPLIGPNIPVHGLLIDVQTGRLEWIVNGYEAREGGALSAVQAVAQTVTGAVQQAAADVLGLAAAKLPELSLGDLKLPELKIGETTLDPGKWLSQVQVPGDAAAAGQPAEAVQASASETERRFQKARKYRVIGADKKVYGPIEGSRILEWIADGRIDWKTASQMEGSTEWRPLSAWADAASRPVPLPPPIQPAPHLVRSKKH